MYDITLVCTHHSECGKCNSHELYKILEDINPEVIFDELPSHLFDKYYSDTPDIDDANFLLLHRRLPKVPLEVECLKKYKQTHNIKIVLVDLDVRQKLSEYKYEILSINATFFQHEDYKILFTENETLIAQEGSHYLNSDSFLDYLEKKELIEKKIIESEIQKNRLLDIYNLFHAEEYDSRENTMLANIYNYRQENQYNQAVFLIGPGHRKSIIKKIQNTKTSQKFIRLMKSVSSSSCPRNRKTDRTQVRGQEMEKQ